MIKHGRVIAKVNGDAAILIVKSVHWVEAVTDGDIYPNNVFSTTLSRQQTNSVTIVWIPFERKTVGGYHVEIDCNWLVVDDDVLLGERHVMHHGHAWQRHIQGFADFAVSAHNNILHMIHPFRPSIDHRVHLVSHRVYFRMRRECAG